VIVDVWLFLFGVKHLFCFGEWRAGVTYLPWTRRIGPVRIVFCHERREPESDSEEGWAWWGK